MTVHDQELREEVLRRFATERLVDELDRRDKWDSILADRIARISRINKARCERWHSEASRQWTMADWAVALAGETGELCNVVKKLTRAKDGVTGNNVAEPALWEQLRDEIADVYTYLDLFAQYAAQMDLYQCVRIKFNKVSEKHGFPERL